jgi:hypothetical protein
MDLAAPASAVPNMVLGRDINVLAPSRRIQQCLRPPVMKEMDSLHAADGFLSAI